MPSTTSFLFLCQVFLFLSPGANPIVQETKQSASETVTLEIQVGEKKLKVIKSIPVIKNMTVQDVMKAAEKEKRLKYKSRGKGATAFLTSIDGLKNKGARGDNWIYRVNGKLGKTSFGIAKVKAGDKVTWTFGKYKP